MEVLRNFEDFDVSMVNAVHGSGISDPDSENLVYGGISIRISY